MELVDASGLELLDDATADEPVGRNIPEVIHRDAAGAECHAAEACALRCDFAAGRSVQAPDDLLRCADGTRLPAGSDAEPVRAEEKHAGAVVTFEDGPAALAAKAALNASDERTRMLMENAEDAICICSTDGIVQQINRAAEELQKEARERLVGRPVLDIVAPSERAAVAMAFQLALQGGRIRGLGTRTLRSDGTEVPVEVSACRVDVGGETLVHAIVRDISDRTASDALVRKLSHAVEQSKDVVFMTDTDGTITYVNPAFEKTYGYTREQVLGRNPRFLRSGIHSAGHYASFWAALLSGDGYRGEMVNRASDGRLVHVDVSVSPVLDGSGVRLGYLAVQSDVTDKKRAENALRQSERRYRDLFESSPFPMWVFDVATLRFEDVNEAAVAHYGYPREEFLSMTILEIRPPQEIEKTRRAIAEQNSGRRRLGTSRHRKRDGSDCEVEVTSVELTIDGAAKRLVVVDDVTERRKAETALRESEVRYREIVENTSALICTHDLDGTLLSANARTAEIIGRDPAKLPGLNLRDLVVPEHRAGVVDYLREVRERGRASGLMAAVSADGGRKILEFRNELTAEPGRPPVVHGVALDVTERIEADEARRRSEDRLDRIIGLSPTISYLLTVGPNRDPVMRLAWISENVLRVLGFSPAECVGTDWWIARVHPDDREGALADVARTFSDGRSIREYRLRHADGAYRWFRDEQRLVSDDQGRPIEIVGSWSDVSDRRSLELQLRQAQKMEAVGRLAGGISHDFNNLLMIIQGVADVLPLHFGRPDELERDVHNLRHATERGASLTRQLLAFSRRQVVRPEVLDAAETVRSLGRMIGRLLGEKIRLVIRADADAGWVKIDPGQLEQVLLNLVVNARDAMPDGGRLEVTVEGSTMRPEEAETAPGPAVVFAVSDTGTGIPEEIRPHIFEPFFTTKEVGRGTGLGLATVYGIVREAGGDVLVSSEPGRGSVFRVVLPVCQREPATDETETAAPGGTERLLVVEDEPVVRQTLEAFLAARGYQVASAADAIGARRAIGDGPVDLLLTDVVLPGRSGEQIAEETVSLHPGARVVFMSGYTPDVEVVRKALRNTGEFLQKPFSLDALARKIREVLDAPFPKPPPRPN